MRGRRVLNDWRFGGRLSGIWRNCRRFGGRGGFVVECREGSRVRVGLWRRRSLWLRFGIVGSRRRGTQTWSGRCRLWLITARRWSQIRSVSRRKELGSGGVFASAFLVGRRWRRRSLARFGLTGRRFQIEDGGVLGEAVCARSRRCRWRRKPGSRRLRFGVLIVGRRTCLLDVSARFQIQRRAGVRLLGIRRRGRMFRVVEFTKWIIGRLRRTAVSGCGRNLGRFR